jgi:hypothetical protein
MARPVAKTGYSGRAAARRTFAHIGARVTALAAPDEVPVSSTAKDLVAGSLRGVPGQWRLFAVEQLGR